MWQRTAHSGPFWHSLALTASTAARPGQFLAWALPRRHLLRELHLWEPFGGHFGSANRAITAASLAMLQQLRAPALAALVWNITPFASLSLTGVALPGLLCLELDWMDVHDITASVAIPAGFASGLPCLTRLAISNVAAVRMAPASLPASLRCPRGVDTLLHWHHLVCICFLLEHTNSAQRDPCSVSCLRSSRKRGIPDFLG
jgi:hypothetical protein